MNRRRFLGSLALSAVAASSRLAWASSKGKLDRVGLQLYTVRDQMKDNLERTLSSVSEIGYREVEFAGYFDRSPKEIRAILDRYSLTAPSAHIPYDALGDKWPGVLEDCHTVGHKYIVCPWIDDDIRKQPGGWKRAAETFNRAAASAHKAGIQFAYHNHHFEFVPVDGRMAYDLLLEETDPELVKMELDLCWISVARQDPEKYFKRWPGRFVMVHVKDVKKIPEKTGPDPVEFDRVFPEMTIVGNGVIDWKRLFKLTEKAGVKHYFVENDYPKEADFLKGSYTYLHELRF